VAEQASLQLLQFYGRIRGHILDTSFVSNRATLLGQLTIGFQMVKEDGRPKNTLRRTYDRDLKMAEI
jgi:hypothetical protein